MNFVPFLDAIWQKQTATYPHRFLTNDGSAVPEAQRLTAAQKYAHVDLLLGQIANFCPVIVRNSLVKPQSHACWQYHTETQPQMPSLLVLHPLQNCRHPHTTQPDEFSLPT